MRQIIKPRKCPNCGKPMEKISNRYHDSKGRHKGELLKCPDCGHTEKYDTKQ